MALVDNNETDVVSWHEECGAWTNDDPGCVALECLLPSKMSLCLGLLGVSEDYLIVKIVGKFIN